MLDEFYAPLLAQLSWMGLPASSLRIIALNNDCIIKGKQKDCNNSTERVTASARSAW